MRAVAGTSSETAATTRDPVGERIRPFRRPAPWDAGRTCDAFVAYGELSHGMRRLCGEFRRVAGWRARVPALWSGPDGCGRRPDRARIGPHLCVDRHAEDLHGQPRARSASSDAPPRRDRQPERVAEATAQARPTTTPPSFTGSFPSATDRGSSSTRQTRRPVQSHSAPRGRGQELLVHRTANPGPPRTDPSRS